MFTVEINMDYGFIGHVEKFNVSGIKSSQNRNGANSMVLLK